MFKGESFVKFKTPKPMPEIISTVEQSLERFGKVTINSKGTIIIFPKDKYQTFLVDTNIEGDLKKGKVDQEYTVTINYKCAPTVANWICSGLGTLCLLVGWLLIFVPMMTKNTLSKEMEKSLHEIEDVLVPSEGLLK